MILDKFKMHSDVNWALFDQGMVSGVNFLTGLLLARFLGLEAFGQFTLVWLTVLFLNSIQSAMISSPMMTIGPKQSNQDESIYYRCVLYQQVVFSIVSFILLFIGLSIANYIKPEWQLQALVLPVSLAGTFFQFQDFLRRYFFCRKKPQFAFYNDVLSYLGQLIVLVILFYLSDISIINVILVIALTSFIAIVAGIFLIDKQIVTLVELRYSVARHWHFSMWSTLNVVVQWASANLVFIITGSILGSAAVGILKAAQNIMAITHILFQAMENFVPMKASSIYSKMGLKAFEQYINNVVILGGGFTVLIAIFTSYFSVELLTIIYGEQFKDNTSVLRWFSIIYVFMFLGVVYRIALRTVESTKTIFYSQVLSALFTLVFAYPLTKNYGLTGSLIALLIVYVSVFTFLYFSFSARSKQ